MPNLFVIGAPKCGTTSLHYYLSLHPEISMSRIKEPRYFLDPSHPGLSKRVSSREDYLSLFDTGTPIRGEASVSYSLCQTFPGVAARVAKEAPDARLVYLVRDPFDRITSSLVAMIAEGWLMNPATGESEDLARMIGDLGDPRNPFIEGGTYMTQLEQYLDFYPPEKIRVVDSDRLRTDRRETLSELFGFLGVEAGFEDPRFGIERNPSSSKAAGSLNLLLRRSPALQRLTSALPGSVRKKAIRQIKGLTGAEISIPPMDSELRERLASIFRPEVDRLRAFTGQDFAGWSV